MNQVVNVSSKLSVGSMGLTKNILQALLADKNEGDAIVVARIFGRAYKYEEKQSKLDPTKNDVAFKGEFEGVNLVTGEVFNAPKAYLPGAAEGTARAAIDALGEGEGVEFGCEIAVKKQTTSAVGYVFGVAVPKPPEARDGLAAIRAQMNALPSSAQSLALPSPAETKKGGKKAE